MVPSWLAIANKSYIGLSLWGLETKGVKSKLLIGKETFSLFLR